ncbi:MAG TPA: recombinase family protein [Coriobacteriia bacterium]|nr:recombinase family protein [Coriobacteriia bacterium]
MRTQVGGPRRRSHGGRAAQDQGWQVVALDLGLDTSTTIGRVVAHILAVVAEAEREVIGQRTSAALITKRQRGENVGRRSRLPAEVVPRVVAAREDGMTYAAVAESLNVDGIRPAREASAGNPSTVPPSLPRRRRNMVSWARTEQPDVELGQSSPRFHKAQSRCVSPYALV